jgi:hypothetical protein
VIEVAVCEQDAIESLESQPAAEDLPLGAFAAINEKTILTMHQNCGR